MRRREFIALIGGAAMLAPFGATAQPGLPIIGYLSQRSAAAETPQRTPFLEGLKEAGFVVGGNVTIEDRYAEGQVDRLPGACGNGGKEGDRSHPDRVQHRPRPDAAGPRRKLQPAGRQRDGSVRLGGRDTCEAPGTAARDPPAVRFDCLTPSPENQVAAEQLRQVEAAAQVVGQPILVLHGRNEDEVEKAFATMAERQVSGLQYGGSEYFQVIADKFIALAARYHIPAIYQWREFVAAGGLLSYNASRREIGRLTGDYAGRVLKGAAPADLRVQQSTRFELVINLETAKALGLTIPHTVLLRADEVIE